MSTKKIVYTGNRITRNTFVILIYFLEIKITKFTRNWEKLLAGQEIIYSYLFVLGWGKLFLSLLNMIFAITEGNKTLIFGVCSLTCYRSGNEAYVGSTANQNESDVLDEVLFLGNKFILVHRSANTNLFFKNRSLPF